MRMRKQALKWLTRGALATGVAFALVALALTTGPGQRAALKVASFTASSSESGVQMGNLEGGLFSTGRIDRIALTDRDGTWLEIRDVAYSWSPLALLSGRLHIESLLVDTVDVARTPVASETKGKPKETPGIPLIGLSLARFEIAHVNVAPEILGEPLQLDARANAHLVDPAAGLSANLHVRRLDGPGGNAAAHLAYRPDTETLDLKVSATAPGDGIVSRLMDLGGASLDVALDGSGPLSAWRASWSLAASGTPFAAGSASIDETEAGHRIAADFEGYLTPLVPRTAAPLLDGKTAGTLRGLWRGARLDIERAALSNDALDLRASGGFDTASRDAFGDLIVRVGRTDAEPLAFATDENTPLHVAQAELKISAPRSATSRNVAADLTATGIVKGTQSIEHLTLRARAAQPSTTDLRLEDIDVRLDVAGLRQAETAEPQNHVLTLTGNATPSALDLAFEADGIAGTLAGNPSPASLALDLTAHLADLAHFVPQASGAVALKTRIDGSLGDLQLASSVTGENMTLHGNAVERPTATFDARKTGNDITGTLDASASIAGQPFTAKGNVESAESGALAIRGLAIALGEIHVGGDLAIGTGSVPKGALTIEATSLTALGAVVGQPVDGTLSASMALSDAPGEPALAFKARSPAVRYGDMHVNALDAEGRFDDLSDGIHGNANIAIASLSGSTDANDIRLTARGLGEAVEIALTGEASGATIDIGGTVVQTGPGREITLAKANLNKGSLSASLAEPGRIAMNGDTAQIQQLTFAAGAGRITVSGTASAKKLSVTTRIANLPADLADAFAPDLGLRGTIEGQIDLRGTPTDPQAHAKAAWHNASSGATRDKLPPLNIEFDAELAGNRAKGAVDVRGPDNLGVTARGTLDLSPGGALNATLSGDIPLAVANASLASRATRLSGRARLSGDIGGTRNAPSLNAALDIRGATVRDPESGLSLKPVTAHIRLSEKGAVIDRLEAVSDRGGTLAGTGEITLQPDGAPPTLRLAVDVSRLRFDDQRLMKGELDGRFVVAGTPGDLATSGTLSLTRLDVTVPNAIPRSISTLDIRHVNAPEHIAARQEAEAEVRRQGPSGGDKVALDIRLEAANRIFVQGRGLDVQLGGALRIGGSAARPIANGAFTMERGRLSLLGRELDFRRGNIRFYGSLEPLLDMEAATAAGNVTVIVTVSGSSADPKFTFTSVPALPEDEIVARLLYNKDLAGLSPLQLAQLASEIDKIGGLSSGPGMLDKLKASVGIDVLDIGTDGNGDPTVSAGSYVSESTFVGVKQGAAVGSSQVVIDHELTKNLKAKGELGADGKSKIGVGFEWDY